MQTAKVALYEVFGYILPGLVTLISMFIIFCMLDDGKIYVPQTTQANVLLILASYFFGHVNQSIGNIFHNRLQEPIFQKNTNEIGIVKHKLNINKSISNYKTIKIMLNIVSKRKYNTSNIESFIEREGFYRGSTVGFLLLSIVLLVSLFTMDLQFSCKDYVLYIKLPQKLVSAIMAGGISFLFFKRYRRYLNYKIGAVLDALRDEET